jgi:hypothetical protein
MPVTTRNQSKMISTNDFSIQKVEKPLTTSTSPTAEKKVSRIMLLWPALLMKRLNDFDKNNAKQKRLQSLGAKEEARVLYYDTIRRVTEVMYIVEQYYPTVSSMSPSMPNFAKTIYDKVQKLYQEIRSSELKPKTKEEKEIVAALIYTLQDVEKMIIPFLSSEYPIKRLRRFVDYTGMDTIEPESEYDDITNIWLDLTIDEDPDYEFEEDEDDDLDRYVVYESEEECEWLEEPDEDEHDYSEDEEYVPEDEEVYEDDIDSKLASRVTAIREVIKKGNHTWFIYDDDI